MKGAKKMKGAIVALAVLGLCLPQVAFAANVAGNQQPVVIDVAMADGGVLFGQVVDPQGQPMAGTSVALWSQGKEIATATTDASGYFAVKQLGGGVYQIAASEGCGSFRVWSPGTAPPTAQKGALIVAGAVAFAGRARLGGD